MIDHNRIKSPFNEPVGYMIATEGPRNGNAESFWKIVLQEKVTLIITVAHKIGNEWGGDCCQYFPVAEGQ